jgi:hypothetical protein
MMKVKDINISSFSNMQSALTIYVNLAHSMDIGRGKQGANGRIEKKIGQNFKKLLFIFQITSWTANYVFTKKL